MAESGKSFGIEEEKFGAFLLYRLTNSRTGENVSILPDFGGAINSMALKHNDSLVEILNGYNSADELRKNLNTSFKGSNLLPFPNRINNGKYTFEGKDYQLNVNFPHESNAIHGLIFDIPFKVTDKKTDAASCSLKLEYSSRPFPGYPFHYLVKIVYTLSEKSGFECTVKISNLTHQAMPAMATNLA